MTTDNEVHASLNPDDMSQGGGLLDDATVTWKEARFVLWDYLGKAPVNSPALKVTLVDEDGEESEQYWSAGDQKNWVPSSDGKFLKQTGSAETVVVSTNMGILMTSLKNSGLDPAILAAGDVSVLEGMVAHMMRVPAPKRSGLAPKPARDDGKQFEQTILVVDRIDKMPGETEAATPKRRSRAATRTPATETTENAATSGVAGSDDGDLDIKAKNLVVKILQDNLGEHPDGLLKSELPGKVFAELRGDGDRNSVVKIVNDDEFLSSAEEWDYVDGKVALV